MRNCPLEKNIAMPLLVEFFNDKGGKRKAVLIQPHVKSKETLVTC